MHGTVFKFYQPPTPLEPNVNISAQDSQPKRSRGRPKGSKNKPKEHVNTNTTPSLIGQQSTIISSTAGHQSPETEYKQCEDERVISEQGQYEHECTGKSNRRLLTSNEGLPIPGSQIPSQLGHSTVNRQDVCSRAVLPPFALFSDPHLLSTSSRPETISQPPSPLNPNPATITSSQGVVDCARIVHAQSNSTAISPVTATVSTPNPINFITDVENEFDPHAFVAEGIGEDDMDEGDNEQSSSKRNTFPEWFQVLLEKIHRELKHDLEETMPGKSRHYLTGSFWIPRKAVWFLLSKVNVKPTDVFAPDFFLWDPYLRAKVARMGLPGQSYKPFLPFEDRLSSGFHGFTPSGQWLRDVYDTFIESYRDVLNQHTAMLSARLAKHVFKLDGAPIFTALLTVTNEKGEIKVYDLLVYGHDLPQAFYTDNMVDKGMLESIFSSLRDSVTPVQKHAHLPVLPVPAHVRSPHVLDSITTTNNTMRGILDDIPSSGYLVVGFDSEWNVDVAPSGRLSGRGPPAVIQIAQEEHIYILQVGEMLSRKTLPNELVNFLCEPQVIKVGRQVSGDLRQLAVAAGKNPGSFHGALDLASFAKDRFLIAKSTISLKDLTASILHLCLPKNCAERISSNWTDHELSPAQLEYAACDAYVSLLLYHEINKTPLPVPLVDTVSCGTPVVLLTDDNKSLAAHGIISPVASFVVTVQVVHIPGAIIGQNKKRTLKDCGLPPFDLMAHRAHVQVVAECFNASNTPISSPPVPLNHIVTMSSEDVILVDNPISEGDEGLDLDMAIGEDDQASPEMLASEKDEVSAGLGAEILGPVDAYPFSSSIRSRVLKDIFHVFHMLYISRTHGLRVAFSHALRDALLIPHPADKAKIEVYLQTQDVPWNSMLEFQPTWLWRHCRRTIPPPEVLYPLVGHFNSTGTKFCSHDSIWLSNNIQELEITLSEHYGLPPCELVWVNGNLYQPTRQTVGILSIPQSVCDAMKIQPYNSEVDAKQKQAYLARMQGTRLPVLPVHTLPEKALFNKLMRTSLTFQSCKTTVTVAATEIWNREAKKSTDIYYKLEEQLTAYLNGPYKDSTNIRQSCSQARDATAMLGRVLQDSHRSDRICIAQSGNPVPHRVTSGFQSNAPNPRTFITHSTIGSHK
ncbi:hypothetical protein BDP27DRAFT_1357979 [Rhodocollybia butyracea]|uniref:3'-5' exonuclease n=1 Tax=Rhodocollybia butyracea TaxID=206335 RepID=A0A9P5Q839_9AGAR|nr:hypothetical protein BDP27DRAFT_1357979 [Rhodocollybia butyracea]